MLEIKITDPLSMDKKTLKHLATFLLVLSGEDVLVTPMPKSTVQPFQQAAKMEPIATVTPPLEIPAAPPLPSSNPFIKPAINEAPEQKFVPTPPRTSLKLDGVELDTRGLPWDARIHSRTKTKLANGQWKIMRGIDDAKVTLIENELRQAMQAPLIEETIEAPVAPVYKAVPVPPPVPQTVEHIVSPGFPVAPAPVATPPNVGDPTAPQQQDYMTFMAKATAVISSGQMTPGKLNEIIQGFGLPSVSVVGTRPDLIPAIMDKIDEVLK